MHSRISVDVAAQIGGEKSLMHFNLLLPLPLKDGSLQNGDHLLAIGDVRLWGMGAEQVAAILRQAGQDSIRLVVARPVDPTVPSYLVRMRIGERATHTQSHTLACVSRTLIAKMQGDGASGQRLRLKQNRVTIELAYMQY